MDYSRFTENLMGMDDTTWKRHANPLSVWTRVPILPLLVIVIWCRAWLGWWIALPIAALIVWTYLNTRIFPQPSSTNNWASKATFGERVWLARKDTPVPARHNRMAHILSAVTGLMILPLIYSVTYYDILGTVLSLILVIGGKLWFLDRMVWLYEDMKETTPTYKSWLY